MFGIWLRIIIRMIILTLERIPLNIARVIPFFDRHNNNNRKTMSERYLGKRLS